jgi:hypothetical protein
LHGAAEHAVAGKTFGVVAKKERPPLRAIAGSANATKGGEARRASTFEAVASLSGPPAQAAIVQGNAASSASEQGQVFRFEAFIEISFGGPKWGRLALC